MADLRRNLRRHRRLPCWLAAALFATAGLAQATDCTVNTFDAYQTAKLRGWTFWCIGGVGVTGDFVLYPGQNIGCAFRTAPVPSAGNGDAQFFETNTTGDHFKNSWKLKAFEFSGAQWQPFDHGKARVMGRAMGMHQFNKTYNFRLSKLVLTKSGGQCTNAIDEAF